MNGERCFECDAAAEHEHHVIPQSLGGTRTVPLCEDCHGKVHGRDLRIRALTRGALAAKKARGERTGETPYGYTADAGGRLVPNPTEQTLLDVVAHLRASRCTLRKIVEILGRDGYVSRAGKPYGLTQVAHIAKAAAGRTASPLLSNVACPLP